MGVGPLILRTFRSFGGAAPIGRLLVRGAFLAAAVLSQEPAARAAGTDIGCTGRITPGDGVVFLNGYPGDLVRTINVNVGDPVKQGSVLMTLDDAGVIAERQFAEIGLKNATTVAARREAVQALIIQAAVEHLKYAEKSLEDYHSIDREAVSERDLKHAEADLNEARLNLDIERAKDAEIRTDDAGQIESASKRLEMAKASLGFREVVAPKDGIVLRIDRHVGEHLSGEPAIQLGDLTAMYVVCQVYQGDLLKLSKGMRATIKNAAFSVPLAGTVEQISRLVETRAQLGETRIRLDDASPASQLVGMEVEVSIATAK